LFWIAKTEHTFYSAEKSKKPQAAPVARLAPKPKKQPAAAAAAAADSKKTSKPSKKTVPSCPSLFPPPSGAGKRRRRRAERRRLGKAPPWPRRSKSAASSDANEAVESEYDSDVPVEDAKEKRRAAEAERSDGAECGDSDVDDVAAPRRCRPAAAAAAAPSSKTTTTKKVAVTTLNNIGVLPSWIVVSGGSLWKIWCSCHQYYTYDTVQ
jgi:hypothetical protein